MISFQKIYGLYGLKHHMMEINGDVTMVTNKQGNLMLLSYSTEFRNMNRYHKILTEITYWKYRCPLLPLWNFDKCKSLLHPDPAVPDCHEGDAEEEAEDPTNLGDHGGGRIKKLLFLNRGVPAILWGWGDYVQLVKPRASKERKDGVLRLKKCWNPFALDLVLHVPARLSAARRIPDWVKFFVVKLEIKVSKLPAKKSRM